MRRWHWSHRRVVVACGLVLSLVLAAWLVQGSSTAQIDSYAECAAQGYPIMQTNPMACSDGRHTFLGPAASVSPAGAAVTSQPFELLVEGDSQGTYPKRQEVITTQTDWQQYWRAVHAALPSLPPILPVDFSTNNVLALSEGRQPTTGYNLKITGISSDAAGTVVNVAESVPTITCTVATTVSNRYYIVRTARLPEPVSFRITTEHRHC